MGLTITNNERKTTKRKNTDKTRKREKEERKRERGREIREGINGGSDGGKEAVSMIDLLRAVKKRLWSGGGMQVKRGKNI